MIDVPDTVGRDRILKILLKDEIVANDADIPELVESTQDYTGSDLRDLVYAAAISAVRENQQRGRPALNHQEGTSKATVSDGNPRRILCKAHFLRAKQGIHAAQKSNTVAKVRDFHTRFGITARSVALDDEKRPEVVAFAQLSGTL